MAEKRLSKIAREFNVGISTIVDFLDAKGHSIESNPNTKISEGIYSILVKEYSSDQVVKHESERISQQRSVEKVKETVNMQKDVHETLHIPTPEPKVKVIDKIDLSKFDKKTPQPKENITKKEITEKEATPTITPPVEVPVAPTTPKPIIEEIKAVEPKSESPITPTTVDDATIEQEQKKTKPNSTIKPTEVPQPEVLAQNTASEQTKTPSNEPEIFITNTTKVESNIKVIDKIDLSTINQKTRPKKKTRAEKQHEQVARNKTTSKPEVANTTPAAPARVPHKAGDKKPENPKEGELYTPNKVNLEGPKVVDKIAVGDRDSARHKRKRIKPTAATAKVDINKPNGNTPPARPPHKAGNPHPANSRVRDISRTEVNEEDVSKQVKETLARLTNKTKSKGAKYRKDKREIQTQRVLDEEQQQLHEQSILKITEFVTVNELASLMSVPPTQVIGTCMSLGMFVSINQRLDAETIALLADEYHFTVEFVSVEVQEAISEEVDKAEDLVPRSPIVTVMGHVDHGKTSLLDYIRSAKVIEGEAGGITQHIGAYKVQLEDGRKITFLDTPGHEAFTAMRARGAKVTDIAIIIIAADDNVMPQTVEAINHAAAAGVPIVFAINKIDKDGANPDRVKQELSAMNYLIEEWGGKYQSQDISAKKGLNIEDLLEKVLLEAELLDLKANPNRRACGSVIESTLDKGRGYVATMLIQTGTLRVGDVVLAGSYHGHIKAMFNEHNQRIKEAGPSEPVLILGLNGAPQAGDNFNVMSTEKEAREIANKREQLQREQGLRTHKHITLDEIGRRIAIGNFQELNVIVKGDVDGSIEALADSLIKLSTDEIQVNVIHKGVGQISESDIMLASASNAIVIGFQVRPSVAARKVAEVEEIDIRLYSIIYDAIEELKSAMEGMLSPEIKEQVIATLEVREVFKITKVGTVAGCMVKDGKIKRTSKVRLIRDGIVKYSGDLGALKRFKDDVKEVAKGYECGLSIHNYNDIELNDIIEAYEEIEVKKKL